MLVCLSSDHVVNSVGCSIKQLVRTITSWYVVFVRSKLVCIYKVVPRTDHEGPEGEQMYSSTLPSASALDGVGG